MGMTREEAKLIAELSETMSVALKEVTEALLDSIKILEKKVATFESMPRMSLAQKIKLKG